MVDIGRPPATGAAAGIRGATGGANGGTTGGGARGGTTGGGARGGTTGGIGGGARGGTIGGTTGGGANGGTTGGGASGPGNAIGTPDISEIGAQATAPAAGTSPAEVWRHSYPPACATPGLNAKAMPHRPAPTAVTLMLSRSKTAIIYQLLHSLSKDLSFPSERRRQFIPTRTRGGTRRTMPFPNGDVGYGLTSVRVGNPLQKR
ncbi:hypothetical protein GCM10027535_04070 [Mycolicibacterium hippocampi]|uniref:Uncharacterized protein n=1 Tax=Mycolicibacterium hippocampi TaxID=659824 RepID=A0A7I9ZK38_9MYCO|nr:hypothetical protein MHIP_15700 [Mycolicibacterium hippocampi]